jgi:hypothetical protein
MARKRFFGGILCMTLVFGFLAAGCDTNGGDDDGGFDRALVANWYSTQADADAGTNVVFEITSDGRLVMAGQASSTDITVAASGGHISAVMTVGEQTTDGGSADYEVLGTTLRFFNLSTPSSVFAPLEAAQNKSNAGCFYKKAGGGAADPFAGTWIGSAYEDTDIKLVAANNTFKEYEVSHGVETEVVRGTYTFSGAVVTAKVTEINRLMFGGANEWVTFENLSEEEKGYMEDYENLTMTLTGDTMTGTFGGYEMTFTKEGGGK